jgi:superfamily II DNA or RNA helicase
MLQLRDYQTEAIDKILEAHRSGHVYQAVVHATGLGKTVIFSHLIKALPSYFGQPVRSLVLVHRDELVKQSVAALTVTGLHDIGIVKAEQNDWDRSVVVASVQTLSRNNRLVQIPTDWFTTIIVDECHHAVAVSYRHILDYFITQLIIGFTATLERSDGKGLGDIWPYVTDKRDILWGILNGYLTDIKGLRITIDGLDLDKVRRSGPDWNDAELGDALHTVGAPELTAEAYRDHAADRVGIGFAPTVESAQEFAQAFTALGIPSECVTGEISSDNRADVYRRHKHGHTRMIWSCMVLTEGFDSPWTDCVVIARPTQSRALFIQMVGRGVRTWPGKNNCLLMDVTGVTERHTLRSIPDLSLEDVRPNFKVQDGELLTEALLRHAKELVSVYGDVHAQLVNTLYKSSNVWIKTKGGINFIPTENGFVFLNEAPDGTWRVGKTASCRAMRGVPTNRITDGTIHCREAWGWAHTGLSMEHAVFVAESIAEEWKGAMDISGKKASWRRGSIPASIAQRRMLTTLGETVSESLSKRDASDMISAALASRILDRT